MKSLDLRYQAAHICLSAHKAYTAQVDAGLHPSENSSDLDKKSV